MSNRKEISGDPSIQSDSFAVYPKHRMTVCAAVIREDRNILLIRNPERGWELPGGHVEEGESVCDALLREVKEETGIEVEIERFCGISQEVHTSVLNMFWIARPIGGTMQTSSESIEVRYADLSEARSLITRKDFLEELNLIMDRRRHPFHLINKR